MAKIWSHALAPLGEWGATTVVVQKRSECTPTTADMSCDTEVLLTVCATLGSGSSKQLI